MKIDFNNITSLAFTKPVEVCYFNEKHIKVSTWRNLLLNFLHMLSDYYSEEMNVIVSENVPSLLVDYNHKYLLRECGDVNENIYVELNRSATGIVLFIKVMLEKCGIDFDDVEIDYQNTNSYDVLLSSEIRKVDFENLTSFVHTKPIEINYFNEIKTKVSSWGHLLLKALLILYDDYPEEISEITSYNVPYLLVDSEHKNLLREPCSVNGNIWVELNRSVKSMMDLLKTILERCNVDYKNVEIFYEAKKEYNSSPVFSEYRGSNSDLLNSGKENFKNWMVTQDGLSLPTVRSYSSAITNCEQIMERNGYQNFRLYGESYSEVERVVYSFVNTELYHEANKKQHNRLKCALQKYEEFLLSVGECRNEASDFCKESNSDLVKNTIDEEELKKYEFILRSKFGRGVLLRANGKDTNLDIKKFIRFYNEQYDTDFSTDHEVIEEFRKKIGMAGITYEIQNKVRSFAIGSLVKEETKVLLLQYIEDSFQQGIQVLYYQAVFKKFNTYLLNEKIYNAEMLRDYLKHECRGQYFFERKYFSKKKNVQPEPEEEVKNLLISHVIPMKTTDIKGGLSYLPESRIDRVLTCDKRFIRNAKGEYFYISVIDLSEGELNSISEIIRDEIERSHFIGGNELIHMIKLRYPDMLERFSQFSDIGLRNAIAYYLGKDFSFTGNIISSSKMQLSMTDVFAEFAKTHDSFTLGELTELKNEMDTGIYFDAVYDHSLRISQTEFVSRERACFDIEETDEAISAFCTGDYIPLKDITMFGTFPYAGFPWNIYLLEHYTAQYSSKYKLLHSRFNAENPVGAIVKKSAEFDTLNDLLVDVLANSEISLTKENALQYLCDQGYLARKRLSDIDQILIKARAQKGR